MNSQRLERSLQIVLATMVVIGTYALSLGQEKVVLPTVVMCAAVASVYLTDIRQRFIMGPWLSTGASLIAAGLAAWQMVSPYGPGPFIAMANLLAYLQVVLLFQRKNTRVYRQLLMLSLLQVVVATALHSTLFFGLVVLGFMFLFVLSLLLLFLISQIERCRTGASQASWWAETRDLRRPARKIHGDIELTGHATAEPPSTAFRSKLGRRAAGVTAASLCVAAVVFFLVPRKSGGARLVDSLLGFERLVGFSESVTLGRPGALRPNNELVMRAIFYDDRTDKPYMLYDEPLFRGAVLTRYEDGRWRRIETTGPEPAVGGGDRLVRQKIAMAPLNNDVVPCVFPAIRRLPQPGLEFDRTHRQWYRAERTMRREMTVTLTTTGFRAGRQRRVTPCFSAVDRRQLTTLPRKRLPMLIATAQEVLEQAGLPADDRRGRAKALERHYLDPASGYRYSLISPVRDPNRDPNEDFVAENRAGHCEYFASALALMLRSQGIPARLIVGFKGGEYNPAGGYFTVLQDHAHAWVEVYLEPDQVHPSELGPLERERGAWYRLDPTPGGTSDNANLDKYNTLLARLRSRIDYWQVLWSVYVDRLDAEVQQESIYGPLAEAAQRAGVMRLGRRLRALLGHVRHLLGLEGGRWFRWRAAVAACVLLGVLVLLTFAARRGVRVLAQRWKRASRRTRDDGQPSIEFSRRLEDVLSRYGVERRPGQTHREMADTARQLLSTIEPLKRLADLPQGVVAAYYRVRFGGRPLEAAEHRSLSDALDRLESGLPMLDAHRPRGRRRVLTT